MTDENWRLRQGPKVFIVGAPRSGTSILLFALKDVFGLPGFGESHVMPAFQRMVHHLRAYVNSLEGSPDPIMLKRLDRIELEQHVFAYIRHFYAAQFPQGRWVDKTPTGEAVFGLPLIESIFPGSRLIATKRNGIEVIVSHQKKFKSTFEEACQSWLSAMQGLLHARQGCQNLLEVDQFDLLNNSVEVANKVASHLGFESRADRLSQYFLTHRVERSSTYDGSSKLRLADTSWSAADQEKFKSMCGSMMLEFGYEI
ncbi:sulfotransferase family protein [Bradyrhizobium sp. HKCCYLS2038]|uniref:sulfotransferase family protein n=1 Tax=unclassified Bradyrhizobium TaxID=2631580 RepID=UPI003EB90D87